jgi:hypothetical protein
MESFALRVSRFGRRVEAVSEFLASRAVVEEPNDDICCCFVSRFGQNVRQSEDGVLPPPGGWGLALSGRAAAAA